MTNHKLCVILLPLAYALHFNVIAFEMSDFVVLFRSNEYV